MGRISNEKIMSALLSAGSVRRAAKLAACSETTIRARLNDPEFREKYDKAKSDILSEACNAISARLTLAIDTLCEVLNDPENAATVRVSAADAVLRHGLRYIEVADIQRRLEVLENNLKNDD